MDGVIANFTKQGAKVMGEPYPSKFVFRQYSWIFDKHGKSSCYKRMKGHLFWTEIESFPWTQQLIDLIDKETNGDWMYLTKPMVDAYCYSGKAEWIMKHRRETLNKLCIIGAGKHNVVRDVKDILIDDKIENCQDWVKAGGSAYFWEEISDDFDPAIVQQRLEHLTNYLRAVKAGEIESAKIAYSPTIS